MRNNRTGTLAVIACAVLLVGTAPLLGQATTGSLGGYVAAPSAGTLLGGATVAAVHQPTGTRYSATTGADGYFLMPGARVGGPYSITVAVEGFEQREVKDVYVRLGETTEVVIDLELKAVAETVEVVAEADPLINPNRTGASSTVTLREIEALPTIRRQLQDLARTSTFATVDPGDEQATRVNIAGRNNRYNAVQIDGAVNDDIFGLSDTGTPGGQTDTQPVSFESIQELQVVVSPYDVRQGGFTGGSINAVTRSGSNDWRGAAYGSTRDESMVGKVNGRKAADFKEEQFGFRLGGPIMRDRAFFFVSGEQTERNNPTGFSADGQAAQQFSNPALAQQVADILRTRYGYSPGGLGEFVEGTESKLLFGRFDLNLTSAHQGTLRHNYVAATKDRIESGDRNSTTRFAFPSYYYLFDDEQNNTVLQVNSVFGQAFNELRINRQEINDLRVPNSSDFPDVRVVVSGLTVVAGVNRFSHENALDQEILEFTDALTLLRGKHTFVLGTTNQFYKFSNLFIEGAWGAYTFNSLADLQNGIARGSASPSNPSYIVGFSNTGRQTTDFDVKQYGLYAGDQWRLSDRFTLIYGVRYDRPTFPDEPGTNQQVLASLGINTANVPGSMDLIQPRIGFNWAPAGESRQQIRGGIGVFAGRTPYVWMSNNYQNSGVEFSRLQVNSPTPVTFNPDPNGAPRSGVGARPVIDAIEPDFEFPSVARATLAYDRELFWGLTGTLEALYTQTLSDVYYENANRVQVGTLPDGRPLFANRDTNIDSVYFLKNTSEGNEYQIAARIARPYRNGFSGSMQYVYGNAESVADLTSSRAVSNFRFAPTPDFRVDNATRSFFEIEHRFSVTASYDFKLGPITNNVAIYYNAQSGNPYTYLFSNDVNSDGSTSNDLLFVPSSPDQIILSGITWDQLNTFIESDGFLKKYRGKVFERNAGTAPWNRQLDLSYRVGLPIFKVKTEVTFDILNLVNLIDSDKGRFRTIPFNTYAPIRATIDPVTKKYVYSAAFSGALTPGNQYGSAEFLRSRYQLKLGLRVSF